MGRHTENHDTQDGSGEANTGTTLLCPFCGGTHRETDRYCDRSGQPLADATVLEKLPRRLSRVARYVPNLRQAEVARFLLLVAHRAKQAFRGAAVAGAPTYWGEQEGQFAAMELKLLRSPRFEIALQAAVMAESRVGCGLLWRRPDGTHLEEEDLTALALNLEGSLLDSAEWRALAPEAAWPTRDGRCSVAEIPRELAKSTGVLVRCSWSIGESALLDRSHQTHLENLLKALPGLVAMPEVEAEQPPAVQVIVGESAEMSLQVTNRGPGLLRLRLLAETPAPWIENWELDRYVVPQGESAGLRLRVRCDEDGSQETTIQLASNAAQRGEPRWVLTAQARLIRVTVSPPEVSFPYRTRRSRLTAKQVQVSFPGHSGERPSVECVVDQAPPWLEVQRDDKAGVLTLSATPTKLPRGESSGAAVLKVSARDRPSETARVTVAIHSDGLIRRAFGISGVGLAIFAVMVFLTWGPSWMQALRSGSRGQAERRERVEIDPETIKRVAGLEALRSPELRPIPPRARRLPESPKPPEDRPPPAPPVARQEKPVKERTRPKPKPPQARWVTREYDETIPYETEWLPEIGAGSRPRVVLVQEGEAGIRRSRWRVKVNAAGQETGTRELVKSWVVRAPVSEQKRVVRYEVLYLCRESGLAAGPNCPRPWRERELAPWGARPGTCHRHDIVTATVCPTTGMLAGPDCPEKQVRTYPVGKAPQAYCVFHGR